MYVSPREKTDTALRDKIQDAMDAIGWNDKAAMDELMDQVNQTAGRRQNNMG